MNIQINSKTFLLILQKTRRPLSSNFPIFCQHPQSVSIDCLICSYKFWVVGPYTVFQDCPLPLTMLSGSTNTVASILHSFLCQVLFHYWYATLYLLVDRHLNYFVAVVPKMSINIHVQVLLWMCFHLLWTYQNCCVAH